ncbi:DedA family protein [Herbiconiux ginsengi]|uniref:Membrane protein DedA, SNARE-associated domain n=1 Tax=Herbiconiux ginsengi TaxID=381665 RepID=A0A1H3KMS3_9MICO|nr:DedA family protein [Herbiconiux ginsengi]SDY53028.1 membrane protein DedA, SNARE-associated domain [Herbiconiux ginsengi]
MFEALNDAILSAAGSPWIYLLIIGIVFVDAFFPPVPSETVVVSAAALGVATGQPNVWIVILLAAVGAVAGDNLTFWFGRRLGLTRFRWMRREGSVRAFDWARRGLDKRAGVLIVTGRYIPVGRIAVNLTAGATGFPYRRFVPLSIVAGVSWALYSVAVGVLAGAWFRETPLLGAVVAVVFAIAIGLVIDRITAARSTSSEPTAAVRATVDGHHAPVHSD